MRLIREMVFITIGLFLASCNSKTVDYVEPSLSPTPKPATQQVEPSQTPTANPATQQFWQTMDAYRAFDETLFANATGTAESAISTHMYRIHQQQTQTATPSIAVTPSSTITPKAQEAEFKVIYEDEGFLIRERCLGQRTDYWNLNRIEVEKLEIGLTDYGELECIEPFEFANWCTNSILIESSESNTINFELDFIGQNDFRHTGLIIFE